MMRQLRFGSFVVGLGLAAVGGAPALATSFTYNGFSSTAGLTLAGSAVTTGTTDGTVLRVVSNSGSEAGAAYSTTPFMLGQNDTFSTQFSFRFTNPGGVDPADGITLVLAASPSGLGGVGNGMGYAGVPNSVAIEFDTYNNGDPSGTDGFFPQEPNSSNHVAIDLDGQLTNLDATNVYNNGSCGFTNGYPAQNSYLAPGCMSNGDLWTATISYDGTNLSVSLSDPAEASTFNALTNVPINIGNYLGTQTAYVGFTGSTGAGDENEDITNWQFANTATLPSSGGGTGVPEPASLVILAAGLGAVMLARQRKISQRTM